MFTYIIQAASTLVVGMLLEFFKRWLDDRKYADKKRKNKRHN